MSVINVAGLPPAPPQDIGPYPGEILSRITVAVGLLGYATCAALVGMAVEHYRPGGSLWQQTQALSLTGRIARMQAQRCHHD